LLTIKARYIAELNIFVSTLLHEIGAIFITSVVFLSFKQITLSLVHKSCFTTANVYSLNAYYCHFIFVFEFCEPNNATKKVHFSLRLLFAIQELQHNSQIHDYNNIVGRFYFP